MSIRAATAIAVLLGVAGCAAPERIPEVVHAGSNGGTLKVKRDYIDMYVVHDAVIYSRQKQRPHQGRCLRGRLEAVRITHECHVSAIR